MFRTKGLRALLAGVVFGLAAAVGCGDANLDETGNSKGAEIVMSAENGRAGSASASAMNQSAVQPGTVPVPVPGCRAGNTCFGASGCMGVCDPASGLITACAGCADGVFTDCGERACQQ
jgi:hypothetical protein